MPTVDSNTLKHLFRTGRARCAGGIFIVVALAAVAMLWAGRSSGEVPCPVSSSSSLEELIAGFQNPPTSARPMVRWWWPGGDVTDEEIARELRIMKEAGLGGVEIQSFKIGLDPKPAPDVARRIDSFLEPEWFGHVKHAVEEGGRLGFNVDLTFGSGWPFGGPHIPLELSSQRLEVNAVSVKGPSTFHGTIPGAPLGSSMKLVAVVAVRGTPPQFARRRIAGLGDSPPFEAVATPGTVDPASAVVLTREVKGNASLTWKVPEGNWLLFSFIQVPTRQPVEGGAGVGTQWVLDHLKRAALQKHIEAVGEQAKKYFGEDFGKSFRGIFCDSLEVTANNMYWTDGFLEEFQKRRGYDLTPYLPLVKHPGYSDPYVEYPSPPLYDSPEIGERIRRDYWQTVSDLMFENFYQPLTDWAEANHLKARVQAHGAPADLLKIYGYSHIPETEVLYADGRYDFLKLASSGAHLQGRNIISSETFVWENRDYQTTPEKMKYTADELFTAGINGILYHGFPYEYMDRPEPGWFPFSSYVEPSGTYSSHLNFHNPFWPYLKPLNDYMARVQYISQSSHNVAALALYSHRLYYPGWMPVDEDYPLEYALMAHGYNFDFINEDTLLRHGRVENHELHTPGSVYRALVFRHETRLTLALVEKLREFSHQGLPIVFAETLPSEEISFKDYVENGKRIQEIMKEVMGKDVAALQQSGAPQRQGTAAFVQEATAVPGLLATELNVKPNLHYASPQPYLFFAQFDHGPTSFFFFRNPKNEAQETRVTLPSENHMPEVWDPWSGRVALAPRFALGEVGVTLDLHLAPYGSLLVALVQEPEGRHLIKTNFNRVERTEEGLVGIAPAPGTYRTTFNDGKTMETTVLESEMPMSLTLGPDWNLRMVGKDKNGKEYSKESHATELRDWSLVQDLRYFSGQGRYTLDFPLDATYLKPGLGLDLDLGEVHDVAEVWMNGKNVATLLLRPYRLDVTPYLRVGENHLEVVVTNTLRNRLVGDGLSGDPKFVIFQRRLFFLPSGMVGPVRLIPNRRIELR